MRQPPKKPVDVLRDLAAPRELIEWVRKIGGTSDEAIRRAWIDVTRAEWMPYLAALRGISKDAILRATCTCASSLATPALAGTRQGERIMEVLADPSSLHAAETMLDDLRLAMLAHGDKPDAPPWTFWCKLVLELARAVRRGNAMVGISLALRMIASAGGRRASSDLVARFRDELLMG